MKVFDKWDLSGVEVKDISIKKYITLTPYIHTGGRHAKQQFNKANLSIVERLINKLMREEHNTGKKITTYRIVKEAFELINKKTGQNPVQVLVNAIANAGPREETVRLRYGGIAVPKSVDTSPLRRLDTGLRLIAQGAQEAAFGNKRSLAECLANDIIAAANYDIKGYAISKKDGIERVAKAAR